MKKIVETEKVFILKACYKDNDDEELGVFDSMEALLRFFARSILEYHKGEDRVEVAETVAILTAKLCGECEAEGDDGECIDGRTRYWVSEMDVLGLVDVSGDEENGDGKKRKKGSS